MFALKTRLFHCGANLPPAIHMLPPSWHQFDLLRVHNHTPWRRLSRNSSASSQKIKKENRGDRPKSGIEAVAEIETAARSDGVTERSTGDTTGRLAMIIEKEKETVANQSAQINL